MGTLFNERAALNPIGPAIEFDLPVPWELFERPGIRTMLRAICLEAPRTVDEVVVITSTLRPATGQFSWHWPGQALDVRSGVFLNKARGAVFGATEKERIAACAEWAARIRLRLGLEYDVIFGDPQHLDHLHIEHDGAKAMRRFGA